MTRVNLLLCPDQIEEAVERIAKEIKKDYGDTPCILLGVLTGGAMFLADLSRKLGNNIAIDFVRLASYGDHTESSGEIRLISPPVLEIAGKEIIVVEDIIDSGHTMSFLVDYLYGRGAAGVRLCSMLDKPARRVVDDIRPYYCGFSIEDKFVVGYGLDYAQKYRNLPFIAEVILESSDASPPPGSPHP